MTFHWAFQSHFSHQLRWWNECIKPQIWAVPHNIAAGFWVRTKKQTDVPNIYPDTCTLRLRQHAGGIYKQRARFEASPDLSRGGDEIVWQHKDARPPLSPQQPNFHPTLDKPQPQTINMPTQSAGDIRTEDCVRRRRERLHIPAQDHEISKRKLKSCQ